MNLIRGLLVLILLVLTFGSVYAYSLGAFGKIDFNEQYYEEFTFISLNYSNGYTNDPNLFRMKVYLNENDVEGYSYVLGDEYSGIVLDSVMFTKLKGLNYSLITFGGCDYVASEFEYKNQYSFYVGDLRDKYNVGQYEKMMNVSLENRIVLYDSISEKIFYLHY